MDQPVAQFSDLPAELRIQIWNETIEPDDGEGVLWPWMSRFLHMPSIYDGDPKGALRVLVNPPVALRINMESRIVAQAFLAREGVDLQRRKDLTWTERDGKIFEETFRDKKRPSPLTREQENELLLVRRVNFGRDYMYIPRPRHEMAKGMLHDNSDNWVRQMQRHGPTLSRTLAEASKYAFAHTRHLALPAFTAYYSMEWLLEFVDHLPALEKIYVIWDDLPTAAAAGGGPYPGPDKLDVIYRIVPNEPRPANPGIGVDMVLEDEDSEGVKGGPGGKVREAGDVHEWMLEILEDMSEVLREMVIVWEDERTEEMEGVTEGPVVRFIERFWDSETGEITLEFVPVRVRRGKVA